MSEAANTASHRSYIEAGARNETPFAQVGAQAVSEEYHTTRPHIPLGADEELYRQIQDWASEGGGGSGSGGWIYFLNQPGTGSDSDGFFRVRPDGSGGQKLPTAPLVGTDWPRSFALSPEGARIAYVYNGGHALWVQDLLDPSTAVSPPKPSANFADVQGWSVAERILAFDFTGVTTSFAIAFDPDGGNVVNLTAPGDEWVPRGWSPDGTQAVVSRGYQNPNYELALVNADGSGVTVIVDVDPSGGNVIAAAQWVGERIHFYVSPTCEGWSCEPDGGDLRLDFTAYATVWPGYSGSWFSPDGSRLVVSGDDASFLATIDASTGAAPFVLVKQSAWGYADTYVGSPVWLGETRPYEAA